MDCDARGPWDKDIHNGRVKIKASTEVAEETTLKPKITVNLVAPALSGMDFRPDKLDKILEAIEHTRKRLEAKIDGVAVGLNILRDDHRKLSD